MRESKFDLNDIVIIPTVISGINSRSECDPRINILGNLVLPLITAPMDTVIDAKNAQHYFNNEIIPCLPRNCNSPFGLNKDQYFKSFGLGEIEYQLKSNSKSKGDFYTYQNVLIDIANGNMTRLIDVIDEIKSKYPHIILMVGNVANPLTFKNLAYTGVDFIRLGTGNGGACLTASNLGINYPIGSLIVECKKIKDDYRLKTQIVLDGGIKNYADIIKCLCLGADAVQVGSLFNKALESSGFNYLNILGKKIRIKNQNFINFLYKHKVPIYKKYRGMSTKEVQRSWGKQKITTAEGIVKYQRVEYTLAQWVDNFKDYLKSAMSYTGAKTLDEFIGKTEYVFITDKAFNRFNK